MMKRICFGIGAFGSAETLVASTDSASATSFIPASVARMSDTCNRKCLLDPHDYRFRSLNHRSMEQRITLTSEDYGRNNCFKVTCLRRAERRFVLTGSERQISENSSTDSISDSAPRYRMLL